MKSILKPAFLAFALCALSAHAQSPNLNEIAPYKPEYRVAGGLRIAGSELKGNVELLVEGFKKFHPGAVVTTNFMTSSEGALGMRVSGAPRAAPGRTSANGASLACPETGPTRRSRPTATSRRALRRTSSAR